MFKKFMHWARCFATGFVWPFSAVYLAVVGVELFVNIHKTTGWFVLLMFLGALFLLSIAVGMTVTVSRAYHDAAMLEKYLKENPDGKKDFCRFHQQEKWTVKRYWDMKKDE